LGVSSEETHTEYENNMMGQKEDVLYDAFATKDLASPTGTSGTGMDLHD
jgi:hypothetical protein